MTSTTSLLDEYEGKISRKGWTFDSEIRNTAMNDQLLDWLTYYGEGKIIPAFYSSSSSTTTSAMSNIGSSSSSGRENKEPLLSSSSSSPPPSSSGRESKEPSPSSSASLSSSSPAGRESKEPSMLSSPSLSLVSSSSPAGRENREPSVPSSASVSLLSSSSSSSLSSSSGSESGEPSLQSVSSLSSSSSSSPACSLARESREPSVSAAVSAVSSSSSSTTGANRDPSCSYTIRPDSSEPGAQPTLEISLYIAEQQKKFFIKCVEYMERKLSRMVFKSATTGEVLPSVLKILDHGDGMDKALEVVRYRNTMTALVAGVPIIVRGVLHNRETGMVSVPDLCVRHDILPLFFNDTLDERSDDADTDEKLKRKRKRKRKDEMSSDDDDDHEQDRDYQDDDLDQHFLEEKMLTECHDNVDVMDDVDDSECSSGKISKKKEADASSSSSSSSSASANDTPTYVIIKVRFSTLKLSKRSYPKLIVADASDKFYEAMLNAQVRALADCLNEVAYRAIESGTPIEQVKIKSRHEYKHAYILGRGWQLGRDERGTNAFDLLGMVECGDDSLGGTILTRALKWLRELRHPDIGAKWSLVPRPSDRRLYPNLKNHKDYPWHTAKLKIADFLKELTRYWNVGPTHRNLCIKRHGVSTFDDPRLTTRLLSMPPGGVIEMTLSEIIRANLSFSSSASRSSSSLSAATISATTTTATTTAAATTTTSVTALSTTTTTASSPTLVATTATTTTPSPFLGATASMLTSHSHQVASSFSSAPTATTLSPSPTVTTEASMSSSHSAGPAKPTTTASASASSSLSRSSEPLVSPGSMGQPTKITAPSGTSTLSGGQAASSCSSSSTATASSTSVASSTTIIPIMTSSSSMSTTSSSSSSSSSSSMRAPARGIKRKLVSCGGSGRGGDHDIKDEEMLQCKQMKPSAPVWPRKFRGELSKKLHTFDGISYFVDFETSNSISDPLTNFPESIDTTMIAMIGCGYFHPIQHKWISHLFIVDRLVPSEERRIVNEWLAWMDDTNHKYANIWRHDEKLQARLQRKLGKCATDSKNSSSSSSSSSSASINDKPTSRCFHWSRAEKNFLETNYNSAMNRHKCQKQWSDRVEWVDMLAICKEEIVSIRGCFDYSLKSVAKALYQHGCIDSIWIPSPVENGMAATIALLRCHEDAKEHRRSMSESIWMKELKEYLAMDIYTLFSITKFFQKRT